MQKLPNFDAGQLGPEGEVALFLIDGIFPTLINTITYSKNKTSRVQDARFPFLEQLFELESVSSKEYPDCKTQKSKCHRWMQTLQGWRNHANKFEVPLARNAVRTHLESALVDFRTSESRGAFELTKEEEDLIENFAWLFSHRVFLRLLRLTNDGFVQNGKTRGKAELRYGVNILHYIEHLVATIGLGLIFKADFPTLMVLLLHDNFEDLNWSRETLSQRVGILVDPIIAMSKTKKNEELCKSGAINKSSLKETIRKQVRKSYIDNSELGTIAATCYFCNQFAIKIEDSRKAFKSKKGHTDPPHDILLRAVEHQIFHHELAKKGVIPYFCPMLYQVEMQKYYVEAFYKLKPAPVLNESELEVMGLIHARDPRFLRKGYWHPGE